VNRRRDRETPMEAALHQPPPSRIEREVLQLRALLNRSEFAQAERAAQALLAEVPENRDVLYVLAVSQRYLKRIPEALATLERLERSHPDYPRLFQERGHCYIARRSAPEAITAFEQAAKLNSSLPASWQALAVLYRMTGQTAKADGAANHIARLAALPVEIRTAASMYCDGEIYQAEQRVRQYLLAHGDHIEGMRLLAEIGVKLDVLDDAEALLAGVLKLAPDYHTARYEYAVVLLKRHKHVQALEQMEKLLKTDPDNPVYRTMHATVCAGFGNVERALSLYRELVRERPQDFELHLSIAHVHKTLGRQQEAIESYRAATAVKPDYGEAYWSLANMKTYRFTDDELARMRAAEPAPTVRFADRYHLCFALGKALEDRGQYGESFAYYERGNALKKTECRYRPEFTERNTRLQAEVCTREFFAARAGFGCDSAAPIFIVGLPRSGSTLIEQVLASHSQVEGTMELAEIPRLVQELQGREPDNGKLCYPRVLTELNAADFKQMGEKYLADSLVYRTGKPHFIDKMPNNFRHIGLLHLMLPNARIIDARRSAMACCFSNFKQLFASGQQFTYSFEDLARYYRSYVELMAHWDKVLPGRVLRIQHEDLVADLDANVRRMLDFCGLAFEPACLEFHKTERRIHTASSEQVRQPIYREGLDQWRHFEPWLGALKKALGEPAADA
jgi:tetratricopeptide (TPR) repeat protein